MKCKVIAETVEGTSECEKSIITLETNSIPKVGSFLRKKISFWLGIDPADISIGRVFRVISIEVDGRTEKLPEGDWTDGAIKWLKENDWY